MSQVLQNFLSNAIKFTPVDGKVDVKISIKDEKLYVEVQDTGVGVSAENQTHLFNQIIQFHAKAQQSGGGSGLGLWISKKIVDMHGGVVGMRSDGEGKGSTFYFSIHAQERSHIRRVADSADENKSAGEADVRNGSSNESIDHSTYVFSKHPHEAILANMMKSRSIHPSPKSFNSNESLLMNDGKVSLSGLTVLVVDDSGLNRKMMMQRMQLEGYRICEADDGDIALEAVSTCIKEGREVFDVITMDNVRYCENLKYQF